MAQIQPETKEFPAWALNMGRVRKFARLSSVFTATVLLTAIFVVVALLEGVVLTKSGITLAAMLCFMAAMAAYFPGVDVRYEASKAQNRGQAWTQEVIDRERRVLYRWNILAAVPSAFYAILRRRTDGSWDWARCRI